MLLFYLTLLLKNLTILMSVGRNMKYWYFLSIINLLSAFHVLKFFLILRDVLKMLSLILIIEIINLQ